MPKRVFGSTSGNTKIKRDTFSLVRKPYLRSNYIESNIEEDIDMKNDFEIQNLLNPLDSQDIVPKLYVDEKENNPSLIRNTEHVDFNNKIMILLALLKFFLIQL